MKRSPASYFSTAQKFIESIRCGIYFFRQRNPHRFEIGQKREKMVEDALVELKELGVVRDFIRTGNLSTADVIKGVDFYIVVVTQKGYISCPIQVTGKYWVGEHKEKHPENIVIGVEGDDSRKVVKYKIMEGINEYRHRDVGQN